MARQEEQIQTLRALGVGRTAPVRSLEDVAGRLGLDTNTTRARLKTLRDRGDVERLPGRFCTYRVTEQGARRLDRHKKALKEKKEFALIWRGA